MDHQYSTVIYVSTICSSIQCRCLPLAPLLSPSPPFIHLNLPPSPSPPAPAAPIPQTLSLTLTPPQPRSLPSIPSPFPSLHTPFPFPPSLARATLVLIPLLGLHEMVFAMFIDECVKGDGRYVRNFFNLTLSSFQVREEHIQGWKGKSGQQYFLVFLHFDVRVIPQTNKILFTFCPTRFNFGN